MAAVKSIDEKIDEAKKQLYKDHELEPLNNKVVSGFTTVNGVISHMINVSFVSAGKIYKEQTEQLLYDLLFKDMDGKPYDDKNSQNKMIRDFAKANNLEVKDHKNLVV